jgi:translocation and assembly module TamB
VKGEEQIQQPALTCRSLRKIYQQGLVIPLGNVAAIGIDGWVDFDQNLNLVASFAMVPPRRNIPVLSDILQNAQIQVPITGTFKKPRIDGEAIKERFKDLGVNMLDNLIGAGVNAGVNGLGRILQGGPGRNGPPRDFFPPLAPPGDDRPVSPPPRPGAAEPREVPPGGGGATAPDSRRNQPVPENPDDELDQPQARPGQLTPEQRQMQREERRLRRLEKRAERRLRRGLPPE